MSSIFTTPSQETRQAAVALWVFFALQLASLVLVVIVLNRSAEGWAAWGSWCGDLSGGRVVIGILASRVGKGDRRAAGRRATSSWC